MMQIILSQKINMSDSFIGNVESQKEGINAI